MKAIIAINNNGTIGDKGVLPWRSKEDLKHFKEKTLNCTLLVGNNTFSQLPPLKNRDLIVVSRKKENGTFSLEEALQKNIDWVIGGAEIYRQTLHLCDEIHLSIINDDFEGDTKFKIPEDYKGKIFKYYFNTNL